MRKGCGEVEWFEDYVVGDEFIGVPVEFFEDEIMEFARRFDPRRFHIDRSAASQSHFAGLIASGTHIFAAAWGGLMRAGFLNDRAMGSPGIDQWRNLKPVRPGDTITPNAVVRETRPSTSRADRGYVVFDHEARNQSGDLVFRFTCAQIIARSPGYEPSPIDNTAAR